MAEQDNLVRLLSSEEIIIQPSKDGVHITCSFFEQPKGYRYWEQYLLSDFPNRLAGVDDFKRCGVDIVNGKSIRSGEPL